MGDEKIKLNLKTLERTVFIHVDIDSPAVLLKFWGLTADFEDSSLDRFYQIALERALGLFKDCGVPVTFFCVGSELERSKKAAELIRQASLSGHEIANHSFSHPYGFSELTPVAMEHEIQACSEAIERITGKKPAGFRSPSFSVNARLLNLLESLSFQYDSSVFYSFLGPLMKFYHWIFSKGAASSGYDGGLRMSPQKPYFPDRADHLLPGPSRKLIEIPLPRSRLGLPFYHNFHLAAGGLYRHFDLLCSRMVNAPYLFHLIEFCDLSDDLPPALAVHPNVRIAVRRKLGSVKNIIQFFQKCYRIARTDEFVAQHKDFHG